MLDIISQYFSLSLSAATWVALAICILAGLMIAIFFRARICRLTRKISSDDSAPVPADGYPGVSVIVYSQTDGWNLRTLLTQILNQDYPGPMEVIVVNDENGDSTEAVVSAMELNHPNLYMTFAPEGSHALSRKKLSISLGLKAARHDIVMLTCGNCRIQSPIWLRLMMRHFMVGKQVVLGQSLPAAIPDPEYADAEPFRMSRADSFNLLWDDVRNYGAAIAGHPFIGDGYNLAYSRSLFFGNKGFSRTVNLVHGDDDIFISEIATPENTAVELSPDAMVLSLDSNPHHMQSVMKKRRIFTSQFLPRGAYSTMALFTAMAWLCLVAGVLAILLALPSFAMCVAVPLLWICFSLPVMFAWRTAGRAIGIPRPSFMLQPWFMIAHSVRNLTARISTLRSKDQYYTTIISR